MSTSKRAHAVDTWEHSTVRLAATCLKLGVTQNYATYHQVKHSNELDDSQRLATTNVTGGTQINTIPQRWEMLNTLEDLWYNGPNLMAHVHDGVPKGKSSNCGIRFIKKTKPICSFTMNETIWKCQYSWQWSFGQMKQLYLQNESIVVNKNQGRIASSISWILSSLLEDKIKIRNHSAQSSGYWHHGTFRIGHEYQRNIRNREKKVKQTFTQLVNFYTVTSGKIPLVSYNVKIAQSIQHKSVILSMKRNGWFSNDSGLKKNSMVKFRERHFSAFSC